MYWADCRFLFKKTCRQELFKRIFSLNQYYKAVNEHGNLLYIECFGYMPLLALGGDEDTDNLKKFQILEHIALINSYFLILM